MNKQGIQSELDASRNPNDPVVGLIRKERQVLLAENRLEKLSVLFLLGGFAWTFLIALTRFVPVPRAGFIEIAIIAGSGLAALYVYLTESVHWARAAHELDRKHGLKEVFISYLYLQDQTGGGEDVAYKPSIEFLKKQILEQVEKNQQDSSNESQIFRGIDIPGKNLVAAGGLFGIGVLVQLVFPGQNPYPSTPVNTQSNFSVEGSRSNRTSSDNEKSRMNGRTSTEERGSVSVQAEELLQRMERLQQKKSSKSGTSASSERKETELKQEAQNLLKQNDARKNRLKKLSDKEADSPGKDSRVGEGAGRARRNNQELTERETRDKTLRRLQQKLNEVPEEEWEHHLEAYRKQHVLSEETENRLQKMIRSGGEKKKNQSDNRNRETVRGEGAEHGGTGTDSTSPDNSSKSRKKTDKISIPDNFPEKIDESAESNSTIRNWPPEYDRAIENYRQFLLNQFRETQSEE